MPSNVFPPLATPVPIPEPANAYDEQLMWFSMSPRLEKNRVDVTFSIVVRPYRRLASGEVEISPEYMQTSYAVGSCRDLKQDGLPAAMDCAKAVMNKLQVYIATLTG
jgi:hypothetical protein